jgi:O-antigen ligase
MTDTLAITPRRFPVTMGQRIFDKFQRGYVMFAFMVYEGTFMSSLRYLQGSEEDLLPGQTNPLSTVAQAIILTILCWMWWLRRRYLLPVMRDILPYLLIIGLCALSVLWSDYPFPTIRRAVTLSSCVFFGAYCYVQFGLKGTLELMGRATVIVAILSIATFYLVPSVGHETAQGYENAMRGIFAQKNQMAQSMLLASTWYIYRLFDNPKSVVRPLLCLALLYVCIFMNQSATSLVIGIIAASVGAIFWSEANWRRRMLVVYLLVVGFIFAAAFALIDTAQLLAALNRDPSFTGRFPLWGYSLEAALDRPWLGYGFSGFWNEDSPAVQTIWAAIDWKAPSAHNGYIDILLQIGFVGMALYVWVWSSIIGNSLLAWWQRTLPEARWLLLFMLVNLLLNLDEGPLPYPDQFTVLMPGSILLLRSWRRERAFAASAAAALRRAATSGGLVVTRGMPPRGMAQRVR